MRSSALKPGSGVPGGRCCPHGDCEPSSGAAGLVRSMGVDMGTDSLGSRLECAVEQGPLGSLRIHFPIKNMGVRILSTAEGVLVRI